MSLIHCRTVHNIEMYHFRYRVLHLSLGCYLLLDLSQSKLRMNCPYAIKLHETFHKWDNAALRLPLAENQEKTIYGRLYTVNKLQSFAVHFSVSRMTQFVQNFVSADRWNFQEFVCLKPNNPHLCASNSSLKVYSLIELNTEHKQIHFTDHATRLMQL